MYSTVVAHRGIEKCKIHCVIIILEVLWAQIVYIKNNIYNIYRSSEIVVGGRLCLVGDISLKFNLQFENLFLYPVHKMKRLKCKLSAYYFNCNTN